MKPKHIELETVGHLRLLAKAIEDGKAPEYVMIINNEDAIYSDHYTPSKPFEMLGVMDYRKDCIIQEID